MKKYLALSLVVAFLVASPAMATPITVTLNPTQQEIFVNSEGTGSGWGSSYVPNGVGGRIYNTYNAGLWFDKFALPADLAGATVTSASLSILPSDSFYQGIVYRVFGDPGAWPGDWGGTTSLSTSTPGAVTGATYPGRPSTPGVIDITSIAQAWADGQLSSGANGLAFTSALDGNAHGQNISSGSFWVTMTYTPAPEPATMALLAVGGIGALLRRRKN